MFSIRTMIDVLGTDLAQEVHDKLNALRMALRQKKTRLRDDSVLAWNYANGCLPKWFTFRYVVFELLLMRYLHEYTNYKQLSYELINDAAFHPEIPRNKDTMRNWLLPLVKYHTLSVTGLPDEWPWMMEPRSQEQELEDGEIPETA